jgi:DNA-binding SARP family transcriptional activator
VHQALITLHLERGRRDAAIRRFEILSERMERELGEKPDFALSDIGPKGKVDL